MTWLDDVNHSLQIEKEEKEWNARSERVRRELLHNHVRPQPSVSREYTGFQEGAICDFGGTYPAPQYKSLAGTIILGTIIVLGVCLIASFILCLIYN